MPNFGQGGCQAIEDGGVLARAMAAKPDPACALKAFAAERYKRTAVITNESWRFGKVGQCEGPMSCWMRSRVFGFLRPIFEPRTFPKHQSFDVGSLA
jgi:2-polyprenyl-6-methoxyphenol hydroxylase-like FAD-dependent oxidoreductase